VRAVRARFAALALGSLGTLSLAVVPAAALPVSGGAGTPAGAAIAPTAPQGPNDPFAVSAAPRRRLAFRGVHGEMNVLQGRSASVAGKLLPARAGHLVELQLRDGRRWRTLARTFTGRSGRFRLRYAPRALREQRLRVLFPGDGAAARAMHAVGMLSVYRLAGASWYGGGGSLACGGWLTGSTLGVANKTLPCGTLVTLRYGGRSIRVPVVDRGPYVVGRDFDLTEATKRALGFEGVGEVWSSR
jgi:hypothetical protein